MARDLALARSTGGRLHVLHASCAATVELVRRARADGVAVTLEATPQHLTLTEECCAGGDPTFKVNPPLRTQADVDALRAGLPDGTVDAVATDHAPHPAAAQGPALRRGAPGHGRPRDRAGRGADRPRRPGGGVASSRRWPRCPGGRLGSPASPRQGRPVAPGEPANLAVVDPARSWTVDPGRAAQPVPQHALRRPPPAGPGAPHAARRRAGGGGRGGPAVTQVDGARAGRSRR